MMFADMPPFVFALIAACMFAVGDQFQALGLGQVNPRAGTAISIVASAGLFWVLAPFRLDVDHFFHPAILIFILIGLFRPAVSGNLAVLGIRYLGPTLASTLASISPLFGAALGVLWLGEVLTLPIAAGTGGIVVAVVVLSWRGARTTDTWPIWAMFLPFGAALVRSLSHALTKVGLQYVADPYFAGLIGFSVSALITNGWEKYKHRAAARAGASGVNWRQAGPWWFALSGVCMGCAVLSLNTALLNGDIVTVVPIIASAPVFTMLLSVTVFRREHLTGRAMLALAIVMPSVIIIALSR